MLWSYTAAPKDQVNALSRTLSLHPVIASILVDLGLGDPKLARRYLSPRLQSLQDPFRLTNMDRAVSRLRAAMSQGEDILVFGDYDVDGVTSTTLLVSILRLYGIFPRYTVPRRMEEGYGLTRGAIDRALEDGIPRLLIAVDCGTNSSEEVAYMRSLGIDVIIIDHHSSKDTLPRECILVNPHVFDGESEPWSQLCTVGLVFKLVHALLKQLREEGDAQAFKIRLKDYLDLVAMGTVADLVPLRHENRILAKAGLQRLRNTRRVGLKALFDISGVDLETEVTPFDISFRLSPRINASGRLADACLPIEMLLCKDPARCDEAARALNDFNCERQEIERDIFKQAEAMVEAEFAGHAGFVLYHPGWHPGVVGIVASRLVQKYHRPSIVLGTEGRLAKGSGRSIPGIDLVEVLQACDELLDHWGGHPMAVGVSLLPENLESLQEAFHRSVSKALGGELPDKELELAAWLNLHEIGEPFLLELDRLRPFGQGNAEPVFGVADVTLSKRPEAFGQNHFRFQLEPLPRQRVFGVAWKMAHRIPPVKEPIDLAIKLNWNCWNGRRYPQVTLVDWRPRGSAANAGMPNEKAGKGRT